MNGVNLIPHERAQRAVDRSRRHRWIVACVAYGGILLVGALFVQVLPIGDRGQLQADIEDAQRELDAHRLRLRNLRDELDQAQASLHANRAVGEQPDLSLLLALVADAKGPNIALRQAQFGSERGSGRLELLPHAVERMRIESLPPAALHLDGLGRDPAAVSDFVLRLESLPLFTQVRQTMTVREPFYDGDAVAFRLECQLVSAEESQP